MRRSGWMAGMTVLLLAAMLVTACGAPAPAEPTEPPPAGDEPPSVALILPGSIADEGYNAGGYEGLMSIEETLGSEVAFSEMVALADYEETFRGYASEGFDVVIGYGFEFGDPVEKIAPEFPDTTFLVTRGIVTGPNYASLYLKLYEGSYVAGYIAGKMTETDHVAAIGGFAYPNIIGVLNGYKLGAEAANPDVEVTIAFLDSWDDIALGKEAALAQISAGADVVFAFADAAGLGVLQACEEEGVWAIGSEKDQNELAPETILTSAMVDAGAMMLSAVEDIGEGTLEMGMIHMYGLATGVISMAPYHGLVPDDIAAEVEDIQEQIISGELEVPEITELAE